MFQVRENLDNWCKGRLDDKVNEAKLTLRDVCGLSVVELGDGEAVDPFEVTLLEKFDEEKIAPETTQLP